jgi:hypothetical protein
MKLADAMTTAEATCRQLKERTASKKMRNMHSMVAVYRGEEHIATFMVPVSRDSLLQAAQAAAIGFNADILCLTFETWMSGPDFPDPRDKHPITGERVGSGDLQDLVENHHGLERGWVVDAIALVGVNRAGDTEMVSLAYRMKGTRRVEWLPDFNPQYGEGGGRVYDALGAIMRAVEPGLRAAELIREEFPGATSYEAQRAIQDGMTLAALQRRGADFVAVLLNTGEPGSERHNILSSIPL